MMKIDVIVENLDWYGRENFDFDLFREGLLAVGFDVDSIRFIP